MSGRAACAVFTVRTSSKYAISVALVIGATATDFVGMQRHGSLAASLEFVPMEEIHRVPLPMLCNSLTHCQDKTATDDRLQGIGHVRLASLYR